MTDKDAPPNPDSSPPSSPVAPFETNPDTGTDPDDIPIDNPSG
jgi:hypothetical protein